MKRQRGYYIHGKCDKNSGVYKKIDLQMREYSKEFCIKRLEIQYKSGGVIKKIFRRLPFTPIGYDYNRVFKQIKSPDFIYVRRIVADKGYVNFFKKVRKYYPECKIIIEIFTYPYDQDDANNIKSKMILRKEKYNRRHLKKYVDRFVTYSKDDTIFGVKTIVTRNGFDVANTKLMPIIENKNTNDINLISVAKHKIHHGYDRLLVGLGEYYRNGGNRNIYYHLVGDGYETIMNDYKRIIDEYELEGRVVLYGYKTGDELDKIYQKADLAVASLGLYRIGLQSASLLKIGEYMAKGIPIITASSIDIHEDFDNKYVCKFSNDDTYIDIKRIIEFFDLLYMKHSKSQVSNNIRRYAFEFFDIGITLKPIIEYIRSDFQS